MAKPSHDDILKHIKDLRHDTHRDTEELRKLIMALTQNEQAAVDSLSAAVETLATDLDGVLQAAKDAQAKIDALIAQGNLDAATIAALQAAADAIEQDVVGALTPVTQRVGDIDAGLKSPPSPDAPFHAN